MDSETEQFIARIDAALASTRLSAWQSEFLTDIRAKFDRYGSRTRLSEKQRLKIEQIVGSSPPLRVVPNLPRQRPTAYRRKRSLLAREGRWWARRFQRDFAFALALVIGFLIFSMIGKVMPSISVGPGTQLTRTMTNERSSFTVTDGDTIQVAGESKGTRLVGFNTPETYSPQCDRERDLGNRATARLKEIVTTSSVQLRKVACACAPGTEGTNRCNYGRSCGVLLADGRDVGQILISEGLAVPFVCGKTSCPPTPRPWCG